MSRFPGASSPFVHELRLHTTHEVAPQPCYRICGPDGHVVNEKEFPDVTDEQVLSWYATHVPSTTFRRKR